MSPKTPARLANKSHQALSQEWRAPRLSNTQPTTPKPRTSKCDTHTCTATNTQTKRHNTLASGNTRNQRRRRRQHQQPQYPARHLRHPRQHRTNTRNHRMTMLHPRRYKHVNHRPPPRATTNSIHTIGNTNTTNNQANTTPSPSPSPSPAAPPSSPSPTIPTHANTGYNAYITQANGIKHTIASITPPSASPPATSATRGNQSHHNQ